MKTLISLDLASQETFEDASNAFWMLFLPKNWLGHSAQSQVQSFLESSVYQNSATSPRQYASLYFSGRAALRLLLRSLNLPKDSMVAVQGFTCAAVALPIISLGLNPLYIDIHTQDFSMDVGDLRRKYIPAVRILILQHSFGIVPTDRDEILRFCAEHDIFVVEDLAHGFMPNTLNAPSQNPKYAALVSFGRSKLISSVFGAGIITPHTEVAERLQIEQKRLLKAPKSLVLRCLGYKILTSIIKHTYFLLFGRLLHRVCIMLKLFPPEISTLEKGGIYDPNYEYQYPEVLAHTLLIQIRRLPSQLKQIQSTVGEYEKQLGQSAHYPSLPLNRFPWLLPKTVTRDNILRHFYKQGVLLGSWYNRTVGPEKIDLHAVHYQQGTCPVAESASRRVINLPTNVTIDIARGIAGDLANLSV